MPAPYKTLVLCFDGTWNSLKSNTNVSRIYSEIADASTGCKTQQKFYDEGVGTKFGEKVRGGAFGVGLDRNIRLGYAWLATTFECERGAIQPTPATVIAAALTPPPVEATLTTSATAVKQVASAEVADGLDPTSTATVTTTKVTVAATTVIPKRKPNGDIEEMPPHSSGVDFLAGSDLYLIGFSRGAFTARSLGGLINYLGIPEIDPTQASKADGALADHPSIVEAWGLYAARPSDADRRATDSATKQKVADHDAQVAAFRRRPTTRYPIRIHFVGVWDTVGALGIPRVAWLPRSTAYQFHDTSLSESIRNAYHAIAIDEHRQEYTATLWTATTPTTENIEQCWFPGAHADVGGGYEDDLLPAPPLLWMAQRAAKCGLQFVNDRRVPDAAGQIEACAAASPAAFDLTGTEYLSPVHDSYADFLDGVYAAVQYLPWMTGRVYRRMLVPADGCEQSIDGTAFQKWRADPEYRPPNLGQAGRQDVTYAMARDVDGDGQADVVVQQTTTTVVVSGAQS